MNLCEEKEVEQTHILDLETGRTDDCKPLNDLLCAFCTLPLLCRGTQHNQGHVPKVGMSL